MISFASQIPPTVMLAVVLPQLLFNLATCPGRHVQLHSGHAVGAGMLFRCHTGGARSTQWTSRAADRVTGWGGWRSPASETLRLLKNFEIFSNVRTHTNVYALQKLTQDCLLKIKSAADAKIV